MQAREQELRNREETFRRKLDERIDDRLREARREIDAVVDALKARTDAMAADAAARSAPRLVIPTGETGAARADARAAVEAVARRLRAGHDDAAAAAPAAARPPAAPGRPAAIGDRVAVGALGLEGVVQALHDREAEIDVRGKRLRARLDELRVLLPAPVGAPQPAKVRVNVELQTRDGSLTELNVIGCRVDEALERTEKFLDEAMLAELKSVRVIHGYGTGQLRRAIAAYLHDHRSVASFASAPPEQGGGGVTVVELRD
jgi:DNA mismatch repair protein MutS2